MREGEPHQLGSILNYYNFYDHALNMEERSLMTVTQITATSSPEVNVQETNVKVKKQ